MLGGQRFNDVTFVKLERVISKRFFLRLFTLQINIVKDHIHEVEELQRKKFVKYAVSFENNNENQKGCSSSPNSMILPTVLLYTSQHCTHNSHTPGLLWSRIVRKSQWILLLLVEEKLRLPIITVGGRSLLNQNETTEWRIFLLFGVNLFNDVSDNPEETSLEPIPEEVMAGLCKGGRHGLYIQYNLSFIRVVVFVSICWFCGVRSK